MQCRHPQEMHRQNHWQMYWYCCQQSGYCGTYHIFVQYAMYCEPSPYVLKFQFSVDIFSLCFFFVVAVKCLSLIL